jgi:hypothetical protein
MQPKAFIYCRISDDKPGAKLGVQRQEEHWRGPLCGSSSGNGIIGLVESAVAEHREQDVTAAAG